MKKALILFIFVMLISSRGFCAPTGNPNDVQTPKGPGLVEMDKNYLGFLKAGGYAEVVFDKRLKGGGDASDIKLQNEWYFGKISYNIANRLDAFLLLGALKTKYDWNQNGHTIKGAGTTHFGLGFGANLFLFEFPQQKIRFTANGAYRMSEPRVDKLSLDGTNIQGPASNRTFKISEWQTGLNVSKEFELGPYTSHVSLIPYFGVRYSDSSVTASFTYAGTDYELRKSGNRTKVGISIGADFLPTENISLNLEGQFVDQTAVSGGFTAKF